ncbi:MAG: hypothetical protein AB1403_16875 [Candidatus Riflebacteria bacterium]
MTQFNKNSAELIEQANKAELHCHLDGLLCPEYIITAKAQGYCPELDIDSMRSHYPVTSLEGWLKLGEFLGPHVNGNGELLLQILRIHLQSLRLQNVRYAEIMLSCFLRLPEDQLFPLMRQYRDVANDFPDIQVGLTWALARFPNRQMFEDKLNKAISLWRLGYVDGIVFAGDEKACRIKDYADLFDNLAKENIPVEIHAGEWCGPESIWDAIEYGHPRRIGHVVCLFDDPDLPKYFAKNHLHIEFCPTSNLKLTGLRKIEEHPVFKAIDLGLNFSINTDDPGHLECSMNSEFKLLDSVRPFKKEELERIYVNSINAAFRPVNQK